MILNIIVGSLGWKYQKILDEINISKRVIYFQNLNDKDLNILYYLKKHVFLIHIPKALGYQSLSQ